MRILTAFAAAAALMWSAPALAASGTLTYDGKTIAVKEISGGAIYANTGNGGTILEQIQVEVDPKGLTVLLPLADTMIKGGKDMNSRLAELNQGLQQNLYIPQNAALALQQLDEQVQGMFYVMD